MKGCEVRGSRGGAGVREPCHGAAVGGGSAWRRGRWGVRWRRLTAGRVVAPGSAACAVAPGSAGRAIPPAAAEPSPPTSSGVKGSLNGRLRCTGPGGRPTAAATARPTAARICAAVPPTAGASRTAAPNSPTCATVWLAPVPTSSGGRSAVSASSGTPACAASSTAGRRFAAAVPDVVATGTGRPDANASPSARNPAVRSSMRTCSRRRPAASAACRANASGALREPGHSTASVTPQRTSSSTTVRAASVAGFTAGSPRSAPAAARWPPAPPAPPAGPARTSRTAPGRSAARSGRGSSAGCGRRAAGGAAPASTARSGRSTAFDASSRAPMCASSDPSGRSHTIPPPVPGVEAGRELGVGGEQVETRRAPIDLDDDAEQPLGLRRLRLRRRSGAGTSTPARSAAPPGRAWPRPAASPPPRSPTSPAAT